MLLCPWAPSLYEAGHITDVDNTLEELAAFHRHSETEQVVHM